MERSWLVGLLGLALGILGLGGCGGTGSFPQGPESRLSPPGNLPARGAAYQSVTVPSFDGTSIAFTLFQPSLQAGEKAPLILHGHGFGGHRIRSPQDTSTDHPVIGEVVLRAWRSGYYVISFDQRGFGDSGGYVRVMDPDVEVRDVQALLDWAQANLRLAYRGDRPLIGTFGASYGGGFQLLTAARDPRIVAMVPMVTWYDLPYSLAPGNVVKTAWSSLLLLGGTLGSGGRMDPYLYENYIRGLLSGGLAPEARAFFHYRSLAYFCEHGGPYPTDALVIQGMRDTLFNLNEGSWIAHCLAQKGGDVRLLTVQGGHVLPYLQAPAGGVNCGPVGQEDPAEIVLAWFDEKLKGKAGRAAGIPRLCLSLDHEEALIAERLEVPRGGVEHEVPPTWLLPLQGLSGLGDAALRLLESLLRPVSSPLLPYLNPALGLLERGISSFTGALAGPAFVPLKTFHEETILAGIPLFQLEVRGVLEVSNPVVFVGVGVWRSDGRMEIVDEQVYPLKGFGVHVGELVGVGARLTPGDTLGLVLFGLQEQFLLHGNRTPFTARVQGRVYLPYK